MLGKKNIYLSKEQELKIKYLPEFMKWNEFKNINFHQKCWKRFWKRTYKGSFTDKILDYGCGPCWCSFIGKYLGYRNIVNLDINLDHVKEIFSRYTSIIEEDVVYWNGKNMPFQDNEFNSVVSKASITKLVKSDLVAMVSELSRITKNNGSWYISPLYMLENFKNQLIKNELNYVCEEKKIQIIGWSHINFCQRYYLREKAIQLKNIKGKVKRCM